MLFLIVCGMKKGIYSSRLERLSSTGLQWTRMAVSAVCSCFVLDDDINATSVTNDNKTFVFLGQQRVGRKTMLTPKYVLNFPEHFQNRVFICGLKISIVITWEMTKQIDCNEVKWVVIFIQERERAAVWACQFSKWMGFETASADFCFIEQ